MWAEHLTIMQRMTFMAGLLALIPQAPVLPADWQWYIGAFLSYSGGSAPDLHRVPYSPLRAP